ncbi:RusA family crossover junction endodeoxyribonuclease [Desulforamulus aquiferis]|uniref:RusA family crossover junction endodeoxyribonuclease n=1 Tax=Desulforamulus aquiferis TaxID=1397668 RepID=A0AAW7ZES6_9FIRM|nr:RusA family crossover junction endodeoxyribonuclease [Desulforamulus aquiferis]MDO7787891.1 RusA family crossover junction endodeoxyribonuclease [Desulforamulus aquiferis]
MQLQTAVKKVLPVKVSFTVPGRPVPKQRPRMGKGGIVYTPKNCREYEGKVAKTAHTIFRRPYAGPVALEVNLFLASRPGDLDNYVKSISDGLNGIAYLDDRQVVELKAKLTVQRGLPERAEVTVTAIPLCFT